MSGLESKAKTSEQICKITSEYWSGNEDIENGFPKKQWVPLEEAHKLEQSRDFFKNKWEIAMNRLIAYEKQIGEALKILDEFPVYPMKETRGNWLKRLREALK